MTTATPRATCVVGFGPRRSSDFRGRPDGRLLGVPRLGHVAHRGKRQFDDDPWPIITNADSGQRLDPLHADLDPLAAFVANLMAFDRRLPEACCRRWVSRKRRHRENPGNLGIRDSVVAQTLVVGAVHLSGVEGRFDRELDNVGAAPRKDCIEVLDEAATSLAVRAEQFAEGQVGRLTVVALSRGRDCDEHHLLQDGGDVSAPRYVPVCLRRGAQGSGRVRQRLEEVRDEDDAQRLSDLFVDAASPLASCSGIGFSWANSMPPRPAHADLRRVESMSLM